MTSPDLLQRVAVQQDRAQEAAAAARSTQLLDRVGRQVATRLAQISLDDALCDIIHIVGALRGFVGAASPSGWSLLCSRGTHGIDLGEQGVLCGEIVDQALLTGESISVECQRTRGEGSSEPPRQTVTCLPLHELHRTVGFLYLEHDAIEEPLDRDALRILESCLPAFAALVARQPQQFVDRALPGILTRSASLQRVLIELNRVARFDSSLLFFGETGTGKSLIASRVHAASQRENGPFVHLNCGAIPTELLEGEMFGSEIGSFTGASARRIGHFESAEGGTIFLDELEAMPISCQAKLLVALQKRTITRLGSSAEIPFDVRVIAATSTEPRQAIANGTLREDLYYRIAVFEFHLPPLRSRVQDIELLATHHLERIRARYAIAPVRFESTAVQSLLRYDWPGNVRELENVVERAALLAVDGVIRDVPLGGSKHALAPCTDGEMVIRHLHRAARALVDKMNERPDLRCLDAAAVFRGAVLLALIRRHGTATEAFRYIGADHQVRSRNHTRILRRELDRLQALAQNLGEDL